MKAALQKHINVSALEQDIQMIEKRYKARISDLEDQVRDLENEGVVLESKLQDVKRQKLIADYDFQAEKIAFQKRIKELEEENIRAENAQVVKKNSEMQQHIEELKLQKKAMQKQHIEELRLQEKSMQKQHIEELRLQKKAMQKQHIEELRLQKMSMQKQWRKTND